MNNIDFSNPSIFQEKTLLLKKQNIEYFVYLIRIAMADGTICKSELKLLYQMGKKLGFVNTEIDNLIDTTSKASYIPPSEFSKRFEQVYFVVKMALVDGKIDKNEMRLSSNFAAKSGFNENDIPNLLSMFINGIKQDKSVEELLEFYKHEKKFESL